MRGAAAVCCVDTGTHNITGTSSAVCAVHREHASGELRWSLLGIWSPMAGHSRSGEIPLASVGGCQ